jgi:hypothetical protein
MTFKNIYIGTIEAPLPYLQNSQLCLIGDYKLLRLDWQDGCNLGWRLSPLGRNMGGYATPSADGKTIFVADFYNLMAVATPE